MTATLRRAATVAVPLAVVLGAAACGSSGSGGSGGSCGAGGVAIVAGENQYGDVASQIGGRFVSVYSVLSNPNTDPHTYEATPSTAAKVAAAQLLIENGVGYDSFMSKLASASPSSSRKVIDVQQLLGLPDSTPNPHLWYDPATMPAVARAITGDLSGLDPSHAATFRVNEAKFLASLRPWTDAIAAFKAKHPRIAAASTEPVGDYLLTAMGIDNLTPFSFQADVMNGTDPSPQAVSLVEDLLTRHKVKVFVYNQQVTDPLTQTILQTAVSAGVPVVGLYETMPAPGYDYQTWMMAELTAIEKAAVDGKSTQHL